MLADTTVDFDPNDELVQLRNENAALREQLEKFENTVDAKIEQFYEKSPHLDYTPQLLATILVGSGGNDNLAVSEGRTVPSSRMWAFSVVIVAK